MTSNPSLPADDRSPTSGEQDDNVLKRQLEDVIARYFYESCDGVTQSLLMTCEWFITTTSPGLTLVINCPGMAINWRVLNNIVPLAIQLEQFAASARIRVCPPMGMGSPYEIRVDEAAIYRDLPENGYA